jgi:hypothetical protein
MWNTVFLFFNGWGLLGVAVFALAYALSHSLALKGLASLEFYCKVIGFVALISIFILSGWKAGLLALPIGFICSMLGALIARNLWTSHVP